MPEHQTKTLRKSTGAEKDMTRQRRVEAGRRVWIKHTGAELLKTWGRLGRATGPDFSK